MTNTQWLDDVFGGVMLAVAVYSAGRLLAARLWSRPTHRDVDVAHVLMGTSMAGQLVSDLNPIPNGVWELVFISLAAWFAWRCYEFVQHPGTDTRYDDHVHRLSRRLVHLTMSLAMVYMYFAAVPARIGTGMAMGTATGTTADFVLIPTVFIGVLLASAVWELDGIGRFAPAAAPRRPVRELVPAAGGPAPDRRTTRVSPSGRAGAGAAETPDARPWLAPRLEAGAHIAMAVTMAYMLVLML